jgi:hypothetical protein
MPFLNQIRKSFKNMKKNLLVLFFVAYGFSVQAQFNYGVELGAGISSLIASNPDATDAFGYRGGVFVSHTYGKGALRSFYESGIFYEKKGGRLTGFIPHYADDVRNMTLHFHYVGIPLKIGWHLTPHLALKFGAYVAYGLSGSGTIAYNNGSDRLFETSIKNVFKHESFTHSQTLYRFTPFRPWDWGSILEADFRFFKPVIIRLSIYLGYSNLHTEYDKAIRNSSGSISVVYTFKN